MNKYTLMNKLIDSIRAEDLTESQAAEKYGVRRLVIIELLLGHMHKFSVESLVEMVECGQTKHSLSD